MQNFIVLGYIPGTQIQLGFTAWLGIFIAFITITTVIARRRQLTHRWVARRLARHISRHQLA